ncbi:hypothetical protein [Sphingopyxis terrae]|uniref:hypothetical protein n=1 Tax=Sphingopyxis terrae TaxID=33052 RepID=UPI00362D8DE5
MLPACSPSPLAVKRLLKKRPPKLRLLTPLLKLVRTPPLWLLTRLLLLPTRLLLLLTPPLPLLTRLRPLRRPKKRSKSQPFGAMTETKGGLPSGRPPFSLREVFCLRQPERTPRIS